MHPDLAKMEPVECPDCKQQLFIIPIKDQPGRAAFGGCHCKRKIYHIPDSTAFGIQDGPMFLYKEKSIK